MLADSTRRSSSRAPPSYFEGTIIHVREDGEYDVQYAEGGTETRVPARFLRRRTGASVDKVPLQLGEAVEVHSDRHRVRRDFVPPRGVGW